MFRPLDAFFADLQATYLRRTGPRKAFACAILMDNADTEESKLFITEFAKRAEASAARPPVNLIAAARKSVPGAQRHPLRGLTLDEVQKMVDASRRVHAMVHQFTAGHPLATRRLLDAVTRDPKGSADIGRLLDSPYGDSDTSLGDQLFDRLLTGISDHERALLVMVSAARHREEALLLAGHPGPLSVQEVASIR